MMLTTTILIKQDTFLLYKELHEPNACGFERMSAMNTDLIYEYSDLSYEYYLASFEQLIKATNSTSPCTHPCVFLLVFLETNPCPTLYPTLCFWKQLRGRGILCSRALPSFPNRKATFCTFFNQLCFNARYVCYSTPDN